MDPSSISCEIESCGRRALVFSLNGAVKIPSCEQHIPILLPKAIKFLDISSFYFISSSQDIVLFEERKALKDKGYGNLSALESRCQSELNSSLKTIENAKLRVIRAVEDRFEEMQAAVTKAYAEAKEQFSQLQKELDRFVTVKEHRLSSSAESICSDLRATPMFVRFGLADVWDLVSAVISDCWIINPVDVQSTLSCLSARQKFSVVESALGEAMKYAQIGASETLRYVDSLFGDDELAEKGREKVMAELLKGEKRKNEEKLKWLKRSWALRQQHSIFNTSTVEVGQELAVLLSRQCGEFREAECILRYSYDVAQHLAPLQELSMSVCNDICDVYSATAQDEKVKQLCEWILSTFAAARFPAENYWTTLLYLTIAKINMKEFDSEARALLDSWQSKQLGEETKFGEMIRLLTCALRDSFPSTEVKERLLSARHIGISYFPTSVFTALTLRELALESIATTREEQYYRQAQSIFEVAAPKCAFTAHNLTFMGSCLQERKRWDEAEKCYRQAQSIWEVAAPKSEAAACSIFDVGELLAARKQTTQAIEHFHKAASIGSDFGHQGLIAKAEKAIARLKSK